MDSEQSQQAQQPQQTVSSSSTSYTEGQKAASEVYTKLKKDNKIKKVTGKVAFDTKYTLIDVSLKCRGPREDETFARNAEYRTHIRRGLSYFENGGKGIQICRRGLEKFFDLKREYMNILGGASQGSQNLKSDEIKLMRVILEGVKDALRQENGKVRVYKTEKANGENAQVSYNPDSDSWVVASKNVSIWVQSKKDIEFYEKQTVQRYSIATLIAHAWFDLLDKYVKTPEKIAELKKELTGKTMIGEYCGHPLHQHMVFYPEVTILFYAVVDLFGKRSCYPVQYCKDFITKFNLPNVRVNLVGEYDNTKDLTEALIKLDDEVSSSTIEEDQEGTVLYFESVLGDVVEIQSLCKLKTLEYRFYRKMREKLKNLISHGKGADSTTKAYTKEIVNLSKVYKPPKPLDFYTTFASIAFKFGEEHSATAKKLDISNRYIDFLKIVKTAYEKKEDLKPKDFEEFIRISEEMGRIDGDDDDGEEGADDNNAKGGVDSKNDDNQQIKSEENTEEKKISDADEEKKAENTSIEAPKRVVLITPPLQLDILTKEEIIKQFKLKEIEELWRSKEPISNHHSVVLLHKAPKIPDENDVKHNTHFIISGFEDKNKKSILKRLESLSGEDTTKFNFSSNEINYVRTKDKEASLDSLWKNVTEFEKALREKLPESVTTLDSVKPSVLINEIEKSYNQLKIYHIKPQIANQGKQLQDDPNKKRVVVLIPVGIPGMGKTTFFTSFYKILGENNIPVSSVSSDDVRKEIMDKIIKEKPTLDRETLFQQSSKPANEEFFSRVRSFIEKTETLEQNTHVIVLDKNHPPGILSSTIDFFKDEAFTSKFNMRLGIVFPHIVEPYRGVKHNYPLSVNFLLTCVNRACQREGHQTLEGDESHVGAVVMGFFHGYKNFRGTDEHFGSLGANFVLRIPFTFEEQGQQEQVPRDIIQQLENVFKSQRGFKPDTDEVKKMLEKVKKANMQFKNPSSEVVQKRSVECLDQILNLFGESKKE